jgi:multimeric flavodoxin WrbA
MGRSALMILVDDAVDGKVHSNAEKKLFYPTLALLQVVDEFNIGRYLSKCSRHHKKGETVTCNRLTIVQRKWPINLFTCHVGAIMRIIALNGTYRAGETTTRLVEKALEGAASAGAHTEMVVLKEHTIEFCRNCLTCYQDLESEIAPCVIEDDVRPILEKIRDADGIILASPVHNGFVTGLMVSFLERASWTLLRPTGELLGHKGMPEPRLTNKARGFAVMLSAGRVPTELRQYCDTGTPFLIEWASVALNGEFVGDLYAGASFTKSLSDEEWSKAFLYRQLTEDQFQQAFDLGAKLAKAVGSGEIRPYDAKRIEAELLQAAQP